MNPLLMFWNSQKAVVKTFARFSIEILMVLESAGGCCESIINGLEFPQSCSEDICNVLLRKYQWLGNRQEAAVNQVTLQFHCFIY